MGEILLGSDIKAIVDQEDLELLSKYQWRLHDSTVDSKKFAPIAYEKNKRIRMSRLIMGLLPTDKRSVIHLDGNSLNNKKDNLAIVNHTQKQAVRDKRKHHDGVECTSKFKGVSWDKSCERWRSRIRKDNKLYPLGRFIDEIDAARAYNDKAVEFFGEFANLNDISN